MLNEIISAVVSCLCNLLVFGFIPFIYWLIRYRKKENFFKWTGFYKPKFQSKWWILVIFIIIFIFHYKFDGECFLSEKTIAALTSGNTAVEGESWRGLGFAGILPALILSYIGNGICEELLFRGFICKRFVHKTNIPIGIAISAVLFGLMHVALPILAGLDVGIDFYIYEFVYTSIAALLLGYANEKMFNGSIWPSVILHGTVDFASNCMTIFNIN